MELFLFHKEEEKEAVIWQRVLNAVIDIYSSKYIVQRGPILVAHFLRLRGIIIPSYYTEQCRALFIEKSDLRVVSNSPVRSAVMELLLELCCRSMTIHGHNFQNHPFP